MEIGLPNIRLSVDLNSYEPTDPNRPSSKILLRKLGPEVFDTWLEQNWEQTTVYSVTEKIRSGSGQETTRTTFYLDEEEAVHFEASCKVGEWESDDVDVSFLVDNLNPKDFVGTARIFFGSGDAQTEVDYLSSLILIESGVLIETQDEETKSFYSVSQIVAKAIDTDKVSSFKSEFNELWYIPCVLEYCCKNFSYNSIEVTAAMCLYNHFISNDDFSCGYLFMKLKFLRSGLLELATSATVLRTSSSMAAGKQASQNKQKRIADFWRAIEKLAPYHERFGEDAIFNQAWLDVCEYWGSSPTQKTRESYETYIRSYEPFRSSYQANFHKKA